MNAGVAAQFTDTHGICRGICVVGLALLVLGMGGAVDASPDPFLKTSGLHIRNDNGHGDVVPLRGVNLGSWLLMEPWMCPMDSSGNLSDDWSARDTLTQRFGMVAKDDLIDAYQDAWMQDADFNNIAALGMNCIRLPFWYLNVQEEDGTWRADAFDRMDWAVSNAWTRGIYTILDLHGAPGGQRANADTTGRIWPDAGLWTNSTYQARTLEIWRRVSDHFNGNPAVAGYDLLNEPMDTPSSSAYWNLLDACYRTIRTNDSNHIIIMEATYGNWDLDMLPDPADYGWTNIVYQLHVYPWNIWNDVPQLKGGVDSTIQDWVNHQGWGVPCHVGEFNMGPEEGWKYAIEEYSSSGMGWQMWAYKSTFNGGPSSWGVYGPNGTVTSVPNLQHNNASTISSRWSQWTTANAFHLNQSHTRSLAMPVARDDAYTLASGAVLNVLSNGVLSNDTHLNLAGTGIQLQAVKISDTANGSVTLSTNGSFTYMANAGFSGLDSFRYKVWDGRIDSVRNATVSIQVVSNNAPGPVTQLIWTSQPGFATNGLPFVAQPVLQTADQYGNPSTNGLPTALNVRVMQSAGTGPLLGTTNFNIAAMGSNGLIQFTDLQINSVGTNKQLRAETLLVTNTASENLLVNGDFNAGSFGWTTWSWVDNASSAWANFEIPSKLADGTHVSGNGGFEMMGAYDGTLQFTCGANGSGGAGAYQLVPATPGVEYTLTVQGGAEDWWLPTGEIRLFFLDTDGGELASITQTITESIHNPDLYDWGVVYQSWTLGATAPPGTSQGKVEFANPVGAGSIWFDNAVLTEQTTQHVIASGTTLLFTVYPEQVPTSRTNYIAGITDGGGGTFTLQFVGTMGVQYFIQTTPNLVPSIVWEAVVGSTNTVTNPNGLWGYTITNTAGQQFFRASVATP